jgi:hypothetical protein
LLGEEQEEELEGSCHEVEMAGWKLLSPQFQKTNSQLCDGYEKKSKHTKRLTV